MPTATVTSKGQVTIPKEVREALGVQSGDRIDFVVEQNGRITLKAATLDVGELEGLLYRKGRKPVAVEAMNAAIHRRFKTRT